MSVNSQNINDDNVINRLPFANGAEHTTFAGKDPPGNVAMCHTAMRSAVLKDTWDWTTK